MEDLPEDNDIVGLQQEDEAHGDEAQATHIILEDSITILENEIEQEDQAEEEKVEYIETNLRPPIEKSDPSNIKQGKKFLLNRKKLRGQGGRRRETPSK